MEFVSIKKALPQAGHYSQAVVSNGMVFLSGILPIDPWTGIKLTEGNFDAQVNQVFKNLSAVLEAAGTSPKKLLKVNVYLRNIEDWSEFNTLYSAFMGDHKPARTVIPVPDLHFGLLLELDAIAEI